MSRLSGELDGLRARIEQAISDPADAPAREILGAKLKSLAGDASRVGQVQLAEELGVVRSVMQGVGVLDSLSDGDRRHLEDALGRIKAYLEAEANREPTVTQLDVSAHPRGSRGMLRVLVVGTVPVAEGLLAEDWAAEDDAPALMVDHCPDVAAARHEAKRRVPQVVVVDSDSGGARVLVERLLGDEETEEIPIIVLGKWDKAEDAAAFIALGVSRTLAKPVSPGALRRACLAVAPQKPRTFDALGELTLDALGARLSDELQRGLCDAAADGLRKKPVELGEGEQVLTVLWEAIARIRELVTAQSKGALRFEQSDVIDALPSAGWITGGGRRARSDRSSALNEVRGAGETLPLDGFRICVAEDDLSTNWFLCGVLRQAGAVVTGYFDGKKTLDHAYRELPDLIMSDIVMPELDGFAVCRAVKRDVLLRSVPVLLLSWKPDLLQRMRELGAGADGYLLKEASGREILQRVHELLHPRRTLERRIAAGGTVRGRLDGVSAAALLKVVSNVRPMSRLSVRDARFLYEVEIRAGRPVLATRTDSEGNTLRGAAVVAAMLGIGGGRFVVADIDEGAPLMVELDGSLDEQLLRPIAKARAAQSFLTGTQLMRVHRVVFNDELLEMCLVATPEPARSLVRAFAAGATPRDLIAGGRAPAELVERVLSDAARQGAVASIQTQSGEVLTEAVEREIAILSGVAAPEQTRAAAPEAYAGLVGLDDDPPPLDLSDELISNTPSDVFVDAVPDDAPSQPFALEEPSLGEVVAAPPGAMAPATPAGAATPVIAKAVTVLNRPSSTPMLARVVPADPDFAHVADRDDDVDDQDLSETPSDARVRAKRRRKKRRRRNREQASHRSERRYEDDDYSDEPPRAAPRPAEPAFSTTAAEDPRLPRLPMPSAWATRGEPRPPKKKSSRMAAPLLFGLLGIGLAIGARYMRERQPLEPAPSPLVITPQVDEQGAPEPGADAPDAVQPAGADAEVVGPNEQPVELPLSKKEGAKLKDDQGLLEIVAGRGHEVFIDGKAVGKGPVVKVPVAATAQPHEVRVKMDGEERVRYVVVKPKTRLRVRVAPPWSR